MKILFLLISLLYASSFWAQNPSCKSLRNQVFPITLKSDTTPTGITRNNFLKQIVRLENCGLDSIDIFLLRESSFLDNYINKTASNSKIEITVQDVYQKYKASLGGHENNYYKNIYAAHLKIQKTIVSSKNFATDRMLIEKFTSDSIFVDKLKAAIPSIEDGQMTYKDLESKLNNDPYFLPDLHHSIKLPNEVEQIWKYKNITYNEAIAHSLKFGKLILFYFTNTTSTAARKQEKEVLLRKENYQLLMDEYIFVPLFIDDKHMAKGAVQSVGARNLKVQNSLTEIEGQPLFIMVDCTGKVLEKMGYDNWQFFLRTLKRYIKK